MKPRCSPLLVLIPCVLPALFAAAAVQADTSNAATAATTRAGKAATRRSTRSSTQLARADRDGSGTLSRDEVWQGAPRLVAPFDAIDANHDGQLSPQEIRSWSRSHARQRAPDGRTSLAAHFARADTDGNGLLSWNEAHAHLPRVAAKFDRVDANRDGVISAEEFGAWLKTRRATRSGQR